MKEKAVVLEGDKLSASWVGVVVSLNFVSCLFFGCATTLILLIVHHLATWMPPWRAYLLVDWAHDKCGWRMTILASECATKFETSGIEAVHSTYKTFISLVNNYLRFPSLATTSNHKNFPNKEQQTMLITRPLNWNQKREYIWYEWIEMNLYTKHSEEKE